MRMHQYPFANQTCQWKIPHLEHVFPLKSSFIENFPLPCLIIYRMVHHVEWQCANDIEQWYCNKYCCNVIKSLWQTITFITSYSTNLHDDIVFYTWDSTGHFYWQVATTITVQTLKYLEIIVLRPNPKHKSSRPLQRNINIFHTCCGAKFKKQVGILLDLWETSSHFFEPKPAQTLLN